MPLSTAWTGVLEFGFPASGAVLDISDIIYFFVHLKSSSISQLIKCKSRNLQKLLKYFNRATTSVSNLLAITSVSPVIFALYSKDLLVVVLLLFCFLSYNYLHDYFHSHHHLLHFYSNFTNLLMSYNSFCYILTDYALK